MQTILAIDDERSIRETYRVLLSDDYHVLLAEDGRSALRILDKTHVDLAILDMMMPGMSGMEVLEEISKRDDAIPVIVVTAHRSLTTAVEAMKLGAREYVSKPFNVDELLLNIERTLRESKQQRELIALREADVRGFESIIGDAPALQRALDLARKAMHVDSTVLVTGESGTGKDLLVRCIHYAGKRAGEPFVPVSCCAIPEHLVESELFGHEKGAFTGAIDRRIGKVQVADKGTLFLDEIGEMPLDAQSKLLRVLQEGQFYPVGSNKAIEVDVRVICATNRDLREEIRKGSFREDLFYRINVLNIEMPSLRKRREDIPALVSHFLAKHAPRVNAAAQSFSADALGALCAYSWPGNVRELENLVERTLVHNSAEETIKAEHLDDLVPAVTTQDTATGLSDFEGMTLEQATGKLERHLITAALRRMDNNQSQAAAILGTTRRILKYKMDQLGITCLQDAASEL